MKVPYTELQITEIRNETRDTKTFMLHEVSSPPLKYKAGQFITLVFPGKINEERRSYSISATPLLNEPLTITVKRIDNGAFSRYLFDNCKVGSALFTIGAAGFFTLPEAPDAFSSFVFFAAGSGITPVLPLIKTLLYSVPQLQVYLVYSNHSPEQTIFLNNVKELKAQFGNRFHLEMLFSNSPNLLKARLSKFLLAEYIHEWFPETKNTTQFYLCGPHDYMQMITITLLREGVPSDHIRKEIFDTVKPPVRELPPDQEEHRVVIYDDGQEHSFHVQFPETILSAAKKLAIVLPYSCEAGKCGTCAVTCLKGKVWMSNNEVLLDKELAKGRILTCTGYPVGGDLLLAVRRPEQEPEKVK
ncbi:MAG TPA: ferredoxin--NADP reductase [Ohtaekwangia sp.]|nr:ferredoxin--NADP reductase [Ohtaekwangia sp.]